MAKKKWSYYELAKQSNLTFSTISSLVRNKPNPTIRTLNCICQALEISLSDFFLESGSDELPKAFLIKFLKLTKTNKEFVLYLLDHLKD